MTVNQYTLHERDLEGFFQAPFHAYGRDSKFVSLERGDLQRFLDRQKNPLFRDFGVGTFFVVRKDGQAIGRIVAHVHHKSNTVYNLKRSYFGFFDCADDIAAAKMLLSAAEKWGQDQGCDEISGNFNLTAMQQIGVVVDGFENSPYSDQVYNPPHIPKLLKALGYATTFPMRTFEIDIAQALDKLASNQGVNRSKWNIDIVDRRNIKNKMKDARLLLNDGFRDNPMFVPITEEEWDFQARDLMWVIDPRISRVGYLAEKPAGVVVCIPDLNPFLRSIKSKISWTTPWHFLKYHWGKRERAVIIYYSVAHEFHGQGLMKELLRDTLTALSKRGYKTVGVTWIAETNIASLRQMEILGARILHHTALFTKKL